MAKRAGLVELPGTYSAMDLEKLSVSDEKYRFLRLFEPSKRNKSDIWKKWTMKEREEMVNDLASRGEVLQERVERAREEVKELKKWVRWWDEARPSRRKEAREKWHEVGIKGLMRKLDVKSRELGVWERKVAFFMLEVDRFRKNRVHLSRRSSAAPKGKEWKTERAQRLLARAAVNGELIGREGEEAVVVNDKTGDVVNITDVTQWEKWGWGERGGVRVMGGGKVKVLDALVIARMNGFIEPLYVDGLREANASKCKGLGVGKRGGPRSGDFTNLHLLMLDSESGRLQALVMDVMKTLDENDGDLKGFPYMKVGERHGLRWQEVREFMEKYLGPVVKKRLGEIL